MTIDPIIREKKSLQLLDQFPWEIGSVIIGGYSILGYGTLRYSTDLDLVIPKEAAETTKEWFRFKGFSLEKTARPNPQNYDGGYLRYSKEEVTVDLLIGSVRDRDARVDIPEKWITKQPTMYKINGLNSQTTIQVPLVRLEALWALKLQAGRSQDISDLFSVSNRKFYETEVIEIFRELKCSSLVEKLESTKRKLRDPKTYSDIRSALHLKDNTRLQKEWEAFITTVEGIVKSTNL